MIKEISLRRKRIPYEEVSLPFGKLAFYPENPRIYSQFAGSNDRTQESIQKKLEVMDHVKDLRVQIDRDGQVNEPLFCMKTPPSSDLALKYPFQVLEGNSRLAAVRMEKKGTLPPPSVPCNILDFSEYSAQETESLIFSLLGQFHIKGKTDWRSYENGAYIHRRFNDHRVPDDQIAKELGISAAKVRQMVRAFKFMIDAQDQDSRHWSYYEVLASSTKLRNQCAKIPHLHERIVDLIKSDEFPRALDMRDKLPDILKNQSARRIFLDEGESEPFREALAVAELSGDTDATYKKLRRFRTDIANVQTKRQINKLLANDSTSGKTEYELDKIARTVNQILNRARK